MLTIIFIELLSVDLFKPFDWRFYCGSGEIHLDLRNQQQQADELVPHSPRFHGAIFNHFHFESGNRLIGLDTDDNDDDDDDDHE